MRFFAGFPSARPATGTGLASQGGGCIAIRDKSFVLQPVFSRTGTHLAGAESCSDDSICGRKRAAPEHPSEAQIGRNFGSKRATKGLLLYCHYEPGRSLAESNHWLKSTIWANKAVCCQLATTDSRGNQKKGWQMLYFPDEEWFNRLRVSFRQFLFVPCSTRHT